MVPGEPILNSRSSPYLIDFIARAQKAFLWSHNGSVIPSRTRTRFGIVIDISLGRRSLSLGIRRRSYAEWPRSSAFSAGNPVNFLHFWPAWGHCTTRGLSVPIVLAAQSGRCWQALGEQAGVTSVQLPSGADNPSRRRERGRAQDQDRADADRLSFDSLSAPRFIVLPVRRGDFALVRHRNRSMPQAHRARRHKPVAGWRPRCTAS